jgi:arsenite-transporting ATPase
MLDLMAKSVFSDEMVRGGKGDPTQKYYNGKPQTILQRNGHYILSIPLPLVERSEVHLHRSVFDELIIRIGNWKRNIALPTGLARLDVSAAKYEEDRLNIYFPVEHNKEISADELRPKGWQALKARLRKNA